MPKRTNSLQRSELVADLTNENPHIDRSDVASLVERTLELVAEALERGGQVKLSGFGIFQPRAGARKANVAQRLGRSAVTGQVVLLPFPKKGSVGAQKVRKVVKAAIQDKAH